MAKRKRSNLRLGASSVKLKGRASRSRVQGKAVARAAGRFAIPLVISLILLVCLGFLFMSGYRTATASPFFSIRNIDVRGNERTSAEDIRRIVAAAAEKPGVWNADLADIRSKVEKFPFVKSAAVSLVLPAGIRVSIIERVSAAVVHLNSGNFLVDSEGTILSTASANDKDYPFILHGWDESKTEKAYTENLARLKLYKKMLDEWRQFDLAARVKQVDLTDLKEPKATVEDSGRPISVVVARDNLGKSLKTAIEAVAGKGGKIRSVDSAGVYPVIQYLEF